MTKFLYTGFEVSFLRIGMLPNEHGREGHLRFVTHKMTPVPEFVELCSS